MSALKLNCPRAVHLVPGSPCCSPARPCLVYSTTADNLGKRRGQDLCVCCYDGHGTGCFQNTISTHNTLLLRKTQTSSIATPTYASKSQASNRKGKFHDQRDDSVDKSAGCTNLMAPDQYHPPPHPKKKVGCSGILDHPRPPPALAYTCVLPHQAYMWVLGIQLQVLVLVT